MATPSGKTKLTVDIPANLKQEFKVHCTVQGKAMASVVEELLQNYLNEQNQKEKGAV